MTNPPPPGNYPPPQPPGGAGYPLPRGGAVSGAVGNLPPQAYASWIIRIVAWVIDGLPVWVIAAIAVGIISATATTSCVDGECTGPSPALPLLINLVVSLLAFAYTLWNRGYRQGTTGQSIGKSVMKIKLVSEATGQPIGFGMAFVRDIAHFVDAIICYVGFLFPLWDAKRQTFADKLLSTVVLPNS